MMFLGTVVLGIASCGASTRSSQPDAPQPEDSIEDSGKRISGDFELIALQDAYRGNNSQAQQQVVLSFDDGGNFKRQDKTRVEEGAYLIGPRGELVVYIEKVNGDLLAAARVERYVIADQRDDALTLQAGPAREIVLRRR